MWYKCGVAKCPLLRFRRVSGLIPDILSPLLETNSKTGPKWAGFLFTDYSGLTNNAF
jgi:hypothetical protein